MPFKSEAQRKYLWANEPKIARDWTDTYGSGIQAAQGGRIGFAKGKRPPGQPAKGLHYGYGKKKTDLPPSMRGGEPNALWTPPPKKKVGERINQWSNKNIPGRLSTNIKRRGSYIDKNPAVFDALLAQGLIEETGGVGAWDWTGEGGIESDAALKTLQGLEYTGGFANVNDPNHPDYEQSQRGEGVQPYTEIASLPATTDTTTASTGLGGGHFQVPIDLVVNQTRAAEGGRIGFRRGTSGAPGGGDPGMTSDPSGKGQTFGGTLGGGDLPPSMRGGASNALWTPPPKDPTPPPDRFPGGGIRNINYGGINLPKGPSTLDKFKEYIFGVDDDNYQVPSDMVVAEDTISKSPSSGYEALDVTGEAQKNKIIKDQRLNELAKTLGLAEGGMIGSVGGISRPKYQEGNMVGAEMEGAEMGAEMEGAMMQSQEVIKELYDALIAQGLSPQEVMEKIKEIIAGTQAQGPEEGLRSTEEPAPPTPMPEFGGGQREQGPGGRAAPWQQGPGGRAAPWQQGPGGRAAPWQQGPERPMMGEEFPGQEFGRAPAAFGGIMDTYTGRRKYGLGSFIKKAVKKVKKLAGSKLGKIALMYAAGTYLGGTQAFGGTGQLTFAQRLQDPKLLANLVKPSGWGGASTTSGITAANQYSPHLAAGYNKNLSTLAKAGDAVKKGTDWSKYILPASIAAGAYTAGQPEEDLDDAGGEWQKQKDKFDAYLASLNTGDSYRVPEDLRLTSAQGGRIGYGLGSWVKGALGLGKKEGSAEAHPGVVSTKDPEVLRERLLDYFKAKMSGEDYAIPGMAEGGLMNLGGMEKDYRNDGGFVPLGGEEKADDVPARLSKNEFVFTADAVRNAGGGDIDRGAEVMENVMKNLEAGGRVSEESQGQGAQEMFETSERLSEVI
jgi:hypothetical protein